MLNKKMNKSLLVTMLGLTFHTCETALIFISKFVFQ